MPWKIYKKRHLTSFQVIILGFAGVILFGALILMLPISSVQGIITPFHKALFTSTSAVCVTGLAVRGYWKLLVRFWTDSDHVPDTDRRSGSYNNSNSRIYIIRKKNIDHAAKHDAKCDLCTKSRRASFD